MIYYAHNASVLYGEPEQNDSYEKFYEQNKLMETRFEGLTYL